MVCGVLKLLVALTGITCRLPGNRAPRVAVTFKKLKNPVLRLTNVNVVARGAVFIEPALKRRVLPGRHSWMPS